MLNILEDKVLKKKIKMLNKNIVGKIFKINKKKTNIYFEEQKDIKEDVVSFEIYLENNENSNEKEDKYANLSKNIVFVDRKNVSMYSEDLGIFKYEDILFVIEKEEILKWQKS